MTKWGHPPHTPDYARGRRIARESKAAMGVVAPGAIDASSPLHAAILAFLDREDSRSSSSHGEALVLLGKVVGR